MLFLSPLITSYSLIIAALAGFCLGSFLNCYAVRLSSGESVFRGRSRCPYCRQELSARELVPVFSFIFLRGRCRRCGGRISPRYIISELLLAAVFVCILLRYDISASFARVALLCCILFTLSLIDLDSGLIPDRFILAGIALFLLFIPFTPDKSDYLLGGIIGGFSVSLPLFLLVLLMDKLLKKETMGGGDIKLLFMIGLFFNWKLNLFHIILSCFTGLIFALATMRAKPDMPFPFGPAICVSSFIVMLCGEPLVNWYLSLIGI